MGDLSDTILVRRATLADLPTNTDIYNEAILTTTATFDTEPKTTDERLDWFQEHDERHPVIVAVLAEQIVWLLGSRATE
jgi:L-amino acid N-acyltransferase YncA